jgi:hypothetical protein
MARAFSIPFARAIVHVVLLYERVERGFLTLNWVDFSLRKREANCVLWNRLLLSYELENSISIYEALDQPCGGKSINVRLVPRNPQQATMSPF